MTRFYCFSCAPLAAGLFNDDGNNVIDEVNDNFNEMGPVVLGFTEEKEPLYLARRVFFQYLSKLNVTLDDDEALTRVSTKLRP